MRDRKAFKHLRSGLSLMLAAVFLLALAPGMTASAEEPGDTLGATASATYDAQFVSERISNNYTKVSAGYTAAAYAGDPIVFPFSLATGDAQLTSDTRDYGVFPSVLDVTADNVVELTVNVPQPGLYAVGLDYLSYDASVLPIELSMEVDGAYPFYECRNVELQSTWLPKAEPSYDRYGDQVVTVPDKAIQWNTFSALLPRAAASSSGA